MSRCHHSVTTKSGTFTAHTELVTKCQAEKMCKKRGGMLAPITTKRDAHRILKLFKTNSKDVSCGVTSEDLAHYWVGLDVTYTKDEDTKIFSNGVKWVERKHGKIYHNTLESHTDCADAVFLPFASDNNYRIVTPMGSCQVDNRLKYLCFKPAEKSSAEKITQRVEFEEDGVFVPSSVALVAVMVCVVFAFAGVKTFRSMKREINELKGKNSQAGVEKIECEKV